MDIPNKGSQSPSSMDDQHDLPQRYYGSYQHEAESSRAQPRSFSEQIEGLVGSYTRTSLAYMAENIPIASSSSPADKAYLVNHAAAHARNHF